VLSFAANRCALGRKWHGWRTSKTSFKVQSRQTAIAAGFKEKTTFCLQKLQRAKAAASQMSRMRRALINSKFNFGFIPNLEI